MKKGWIITGLVFLLSVQFLDVYGVQRFPKPEFETGYVQPETWQPMPRAGWLAIADVVMLAGALALVSWLVLKKRSRNGVFLVSLFSLAWFGFYRKGCICAVGAIQNVSLALADHSYVLPLGVLAFFILPLVFTLFFGRTFCAGVCPFGALQDMVAFRPRKLDERLNAILGMIPYVYLGLAVLYAATGTDFIICRYDPFVGIFRFNATFAMLVFSATLLASGIFIARPYCRFLCPYGVLLNWISRYSRRHITITPSACIQCRLCEESCPYDAISMPVPGRNPEKREVTLKKLILVCLLIPFFMALGGWTGSRLHETLAGVNGKVRLAKELVALEKDNGQPETLEVAAFRSSGKSVAQACEEASQVLRSFYLGGWILGCFLGLVFGIIVARRLLPKYRTGYEPDRGACFSCARCVDFCPVDKKGNKIITDETV